MKEGQSQMNKYRKTRGFTQFMGMAVAVVVFAAQAGANEATTADDWSATDVSPSVSVLFNGAEVTVNTPGGFPYNYGATLVPEVDGALFSGNFDAAGARSISVTLSGEDAISDRAYVAIVAANGNLWSAGGLQLGENVVSLDYVEGGWRLYPGAVDDADQYAADLLDVSHVKVYVQNNTEVIEEVGLLRTPQVAAQAVTVSALTLSSDRALGGSGLSLQDVLASFGMNSLDDTLTASAAADDDADGLNNLDEALAEIGLFEEQVFWAEVLAVAPEGTTVRFACQGGKSYTVQRSSSVGGTPVDVETVAVPAGDGFSTRTILDDGAGDGPNFYQVIQH